MLSIMNGKDFMKYYMQEHPKKIIDTQYVLVSTTIKTMGTKSNIIRAIDLYPNSSILSELMVSHDKDEFYIEYIKQLDEQKPLLASIIHAIITREFDVVILCGDKEDEFGYLDCIQCYVEDTFKFPVFRYHKGKYLYGNRKSYNSSKVIKRCEEILADASRQRKETLEKTSRGREILMNEMDKKEMKSSLKKLGINTKGLSKEEIEEYMTEFYVHRE